MGGFGDLEICGFQATCHDHSATCPFPPSPLPPPLDRIPHGGFQAAETEVQPLVANRARGKA